MDLFHRVASAASDRIYQRGSRNILSTSQDSVARNHAIAPSSVFNFQVTEIHRHFFKGSVVKNDAVVTDIYLQKWIAADSYQSFHKHQCREQEKVEEPIKYTCHNYLNINMEWTQSPRSWFCSQQSLQRLHFAFCSFPFFQVRIMALCAQIILICTLPITHCLLCT